MKLDLLAIAAHPDDVELTCGGTVIKMADRGYSVGIVDLTRGEMGTRGNARTRLREAAAAARLMGVVHRENLGLPDAHIEVNSRTKYRIAGRIRELRPHTVILPYWQGRHPDHYNASLVAYEACFLAGLKRLRIGGEAFRPFKILYSTVYTDARPTFVVDISEQFERRRQAILCYASQFLPKKRDHKPRVHLPLDQLEEETALVARKYGQMAGVRYAEPFLVREVMQVEDVVQLPVRSI
jgi:bacillithiol biosynthesis deacetylase BshB1